MLGDCCTVLSTSAICTSTSIGICTHNPHHSENSAIQILNIPEPTGAQPKPYAATQKPAQPSKTPFPLCPCYAEPQMPSVHLQTSPSNLKSTNRTSTPLYTYTTSPSPNQPHQPNQLLSASSACPL